MYIAYSAFNTPLPTNEGAKAQRQKQKLRYRGYKAACRKYESEIAAIQHYFPNWQPRFDLQPL